MDLTPEDTAKALKDLREMMRDHVLPRLTQLEEEVRVLRIVTWPVCQSLREVSQLSDIKSKKCVLEMLATDEAMELLRMKSKVSKKQLEYSTTCMDVEEIDRIFK